MSLADSLERAASALAGDADAIRPANGDPTQLLQGLDSDAAARVATWLLANEPEAGVELALAWAEDESGAEILLHIDERALSKPGKKALRRVLHHLRSRGIDVAKKMPLEPRIARLPEIEGDFEEGYLSALDPRGGRLAYILESNPAGGARLFEILLDEDRGIIDFQVYASARGRIRTFLKQALDRSRFPIVTAPVPALRALIARSEALHPSDRILSPTFVEHRARLSIPGATPGDLVAEELSQRQAAKAPEMGAQAVELVQRAVELVQKGAVGPWGPTAANVAKRVEGALEAAALEAVGAEDWSVLAALVFCDERTNEAVRQRLRESAFVLSARGQDDDARACLAAAKLFSETASGSNVVASAMVEVLLSPAVAALRARPASTGLADEDGVSSRASAAVAAEPEASEPEASESGA